MITWTGTWKTSFGVVQLIQNGNRVSGLYGQLGVIEGLINENELEARFTKRGKVGRLLFVQIEAGQFKGSWFWETGDFDEAFTWNGKRVSEEVQTSSQDGNPLTGEWETSFGKVHLVQDDKKVYGLYSNVGVIEGELTQINCLEGRFTNASQTGVLKWIINYEEHRFEGIWDWTNIGQATGVWTGKQTNALVKPLSLGFVNLFQADANLTINTNEATGEQTVFLKHDLGASETLIGHLDHLHTTFTVAEGAINPPLINLPDPTVYRPSVWKANNQQDIGIALQGGGVKGAFGVGALHYLAVSKVLHPNRKLKIASASTGSITGVVLAENQGTSTTLKAIDQYMSLERHEDMFQMMPVVKTAMNKVPHFKKVLLEMIKSGVFTEVDTNRVLNETKAELKEILKKSHRAGVRDVFTGIPWLGFGEYIKGFLKGAAESAEDKIKALEAIYDAPMSLATLQPVREKLNEVIDAQQILDQKTDLYMAVVNYNTGTLCYITHDFKLLHPIENKIHGVNYDYSNFHPCSIQKIERQEIYNDSAELLFDEVGWLSEDATPNSRKVAKKKFLASAALASGAFPAFFPPVKIRYNYDGDIREHYFFDGGIRENLPIEFLSTKINHIISIHCSPIVPINNSISNVTKDKENQDSKGKEILPKINQVASKALGYQTEELERHDIAFGTSINVPSLGNQSNKAYSIHIAPTSKTLTLTEVHPFNIKATVWYGYMRACDEMFVARNIASINRELSDTEVDHLKAKGFSNSEIDIMVEKELTDSKISHLRSVGVEEAIIEKIKTAALTETEISALREDTEDIYLLFKTVYTRAKAMVHNAIFQCDNVGHGGQDNFLWRNNIYYKTLKGRTFTKYFHPEHDINLLFLHQNSLSLYLQAKSDLLQALINRYKFFERKSGAILCRQSLMFGERGFMRKSLYTDWFGVYEYLKQTRIEYNKRARVMNAFRKMAIFDGSNPVMLTSHQFMSYHTEDASANQQLSNLPKLVADRDQVLQLVDKEIASLFEGNLNDKLEEEVLFVKEINGVNQDHKFDEKDETFLGRAE